MNDFKKDKGHYPGGITIDGEEMAKTLIKESQKDIIELVLSNLPHTKHVENDISNRKNLKKELFKIIDDE